MSLHVRHGVAASIWFALGLIAGIVSTRLFAVGVRSEPPGTWSLAPESKSTRSPHEGAVGESSQSLEAAAETLSVCLASQGGSDADWELLAKSYEVLGRQADVERARRHEASIARDIQDSVLASAPILANLRVTGAPAITANAAALDPASRLLASADEDRRKRDFVRACAEYENVAAMNRMTADAWADYADALGSRDGRLSGQAAMAINRALALAPRHTKALWLKASLEHEQGHYAEALATWKRLLAVLPPGSSDAQIVETNVAEASRLMQGGAPSRPGGAAG